MNSRNARENMLARLYAAGAEDTTVPAAPVPPAVSLNRQERIARLTELMTAIRTEVYLVGKDDWVDKLRELAHENGWKKLLYGPMSPVGSAIDEKWPPGGSGDLPERVPYIDPVENFKQELFDIDAGITGTRGAVADTGAVVLWPTPDEPRLLSLVPPVHVAVLDAERIHASLTDMMVAENWAGGMPTNALLISGPSKTADIEFTLVFGVHGPKELILLIRT